MTDKDMEKYLANAIDQNTPDILDDLLAELNLEGSAEAGKRAPDSTLPDEAHFKVVKAATRDSGPVGSGSGNRRMLKPLLSIAAALILFVGGLTAFRSTQSTFAVVGMDVNPGIELTVSRSEKVTGARAINAEGEDILRDIDLRGTDINTACNAVAGAMLTHGYLTDTSNSILMSVQSKDADKGKELERRISENLNAYLGDSDISAAILAQYVDDDSSLNAFAEANGISVGKALLIRNLLSTGSTNMTEADLLSLSTQELILLGQNRNTENEASYGKADTSKYIGEDAAIAAALAEAGIAADAAQGIKTEYDCEKGRIVYEVEFVSGGVEYDYDIDAVSGKVVSYESEAADADDADDIDDDSDDDDDRYDQDDDGRDDDDDSDDDDDRYDWDDDGRDDDDDSDDDDDRYDQDDDDDD